MSTTSKRRHELAKGCIVALDKMDAQEGFIASDEMLDDAGLLPGWQCVSRASAFDDGRRSTGLEIVAALGDFLRRESA